MSSAGTIQDMISKVRQLALLRKKEGFGVVAPRHKTNRVFNKAAVKTLSESDKIIVRESIAWQFKKDQMKHLVFFMVLLAGLVMGMYLFWKWISSI